jgi:hypothetical protein
MLSLLGTVLGFGTSIIPTIFGFFAEKSKRAADLEELKLRADMQARGIELNIKQIQAQADAEETKGLYAQDASLKGSPWIESMRASVRPVITYVFFILFVLIKVCALVTLLKAGTLVVDALPRLWDEETGGLFAAVISFWFGNRAFDKLKKNK